jgi:Protein of unknown function (DUF1571)
MVATLARSCTIARSLRWRRLDALTLILLTTALIVPISLRAVTWWLAAPQRAGVQSAHRSVPVVAVPARVAAATNPVEPPAAASEEPPRVCFLSWPESRLEGDAAKRLLLEVLVDGARKLESIDGYTATFHKRERIGGRLGERQTLEMKLRQRPFAVYLKYVCPEPGKEVVYCEGRHDNMVIAHASGWSRRLIPRLAVAPTSPLALAENRHPITDAGLFTLVLKLIHFREIDLDDTEAVTILDRAQGLDGRSYYRSLHTHPHKDSNRPFARVEVLYDPDTMLPIEISSFDWPKPGQTGDLLMAEQYAYENLTLGTSLTDLDFDPANPDYNFSRY